LAHGHRPNHPPRQPPVVAPRVLDPVRRLNERNGSVLRGSRQGRRAFRHLLTACGASNTGRLGLELRTSKFTVMEGMETDDQVDRGTVNLTVLSITPVRAGRLFALASVEIEIGGVAIELHGIRVLRVGAEGTRIELPQFRDAAGLYRPVVILPPEVYGPIGDGVVDSLVERGFAKRRFTE
jgi:hypothetical protein